MTLRPEQKIIKSNGKQEFPRDVLDKNGIDRLARQVNANRELLMVRAEEFGLNPNYLRKNNRIAVGPFVSPAPLSTTFAGKVENASNSVNIGAGIVSKLREIGQPAEQFMLLDLTMTVQPKKGAEAMDCLIVPKNANNQKLFLFDRNKPTQVYGNATISESDIKKLENPVNNSYQQYALQNPELKRGKQGSILPQTILVDLNGALQDARVDEPEEQKVHYLNFAAKLNKRMMERIIPGNNLPITRVDTRYYSPLFKEGIKDIGRFVWKLDGVGFFENDPGFIKIVDETGKSKIFQMTDISQNDALLTQRESNNKIWFSDLQRSGADIAPCKELAYVLCMANIAPVVYGSQNSGDYYEPYAVAKEQVTRLGFTPNLYRVQPQIPDGYEKIGTIFDFYKPLLLKNQQ